MGTQGLVTVMRGGQVAAKITVGSNGMVATDVGRQILDSLKDVDPALLDVICEHHGFGARINRVIAVRPKAGEPGLLISYDLQTGIKATADDPEFSLIVKHFDEPTFNSRWIHGTAAHCVIVDLDRKTLRHARHKPHADGDDCKGGTHVVKVAHGESIKLCDSCYGRHRKGK